MKYYKKIHEDGTIEVLEDPIVKNHIGLIELTKEEFEAQLELNNTPTDAQILEAKVNEALAYLSSTDFKMTVDYFATLSVSEQTEFTNLREVARQFIRDNQIVKGEV